MLCVVLKRGDEKERKSSLPTLNEIVQTLGRDPDVLSTGKAEIEAAGAGYFESARRDQRVLMQNGTCFEWAMCDPNLMLQRTLNECPNLARF